MVDVLIQPWAQADLQLLKQLLGDPDIMEHLGGPESPEQILRRHIRYTRLPEDGTDHMFKIVWGPNGEGVGNVGYWRKTWREQSVYEIGWLVLPSYHGHGIATKAASTAIEHVRRKPTFQFMHAFPSVENAASNAICRKLSFTLIEECQFEYPPGRSMTVNDWRLDLLGE